MAHLKYSCQDLLLLKDHTTVAFTKPFEAPQRCVKHKFKLIFNFNTTF